MPSLENWDGGLKIFIFGQPTLPTHPSFLHVHVRVSRKYGLLHVHVHVSRKYGLAYIVHADGGLDPFIETLK